MQKVLTLIALCFMTLFAASGAVAANNPSYNMAPAAHFTSRVNLYNQSAYYYTVNASYMGQYGVSRKFTMALNPYQMTGSSIMFPVALPEYGLYLEVIRNVDGFIAYNGYISSDDVYIR